MHLRRAILLFALVLGLTAIAAALAPSPREKSSQPPAGASPPPPAAGSGVQVITLRAPAPTKPPEPQVKAGTQVIVRVQATQPGQATIDSLGRTASVGAYAPATFDIISPPPGRYPVRFSEPLAAPQVVGTIVSR